MTRCQRNQSGLMQWSIGKLACRRFGNVTNLYKNLFYFHYTTKPGTCCKRVEVSSQEPELLDFKGIYKATDSKRNGVAVYQKEDNIGRPEKFFLFRGASGWFLDTRISSGSATAFVAETQQKDRDCPGETDKAGKWRVDRLGHWKDSTSTNVTCLWG